MNQKKSRTSGSLPKTDVWVKTLLVAIVAMLTSQLGALANHSNSLDRDGCWDALTFSGANCLVVHDVYWRDTKLIVKYRNQCDYRIYTRFCNERRSGSEDCGASGIGPGSIKTWSTYEANGRYNFISVGSDIGSKDWVCSGKISNWSD